MEHLVAGGTASSARSPAQADALRAGALVLLALVACRIEAERPPGDPAATGPTIASAPASAGAPAAALPAAPGHERAVVARVSDGDSFVVTFADGRSADVRLQGIDAPEAQQPGGREAAEHLRRLALGEAVELRLVGSDPYGRHVAVATGERGDLGLLQIQGGHAWYNPRYADEQDGDARRRYAAAERAAREERRGLWSAAAPVAPWDFKADRRASAEPRADGATTLRAGRIVGNGRSRLYHLPGCPGHAAVSSRNAVLFESEAAARQAGYRRAPNC